MSDISCEKRAGVGVAYPGRRVDDEAHSRREGEVAAGDEGAEENLVDAHVCLPGADARANLGRLLRRVRIKADFHGRRHVGRSIRCKVRRLCHQRVAKEPGKISRGEARPFNLARSNWSSSLLEPDSVHVRMGLGLGKDVTLWTR